jgi:hypothetical protein
MFGAPLVTVATLPTWAVCDSNLLCYAWSCFKSILVYVLLQLHSSVWYTVHPGLCPQFF